MKPTLVEPNDPKWIIAATSSLSGITVWWNEDLGWDTDAGMATEYDYRPDVEVTIPVVDGVAKYINIRSEAVGHEAP